MGESELRARAEKRIGTQLRGKYRLDQLLGVGGMASVYRATHRNGHRVAIKMLHLQFSLDDEMRERFVREGYVANGVDHKGVVKVIDDEVAEDGSVFVVMELLEGQTVHERWERAHYKLSVAETVRIGVDLLDVLSAAHARTIVHRDIKPENLFITTEGVFKVLDFGIARWKDGFSDGSLTQTGLTLGTPQFMAPEQALGKKDQIDGRSDLWAVGATLFSLLAGRYVHDGETVQEINVNAATKDAPPLRSLAPDVPASIAAVIDRALLRSREARWPSALAMKRALEDAWARVERRPVATVSLATEIATESLEETRADHEQLEASSEETTRELPRPLEVQAHTAPLALPVTPNARFVELPKPATDAAISSDPHIRTRPTSRLPLIVGVLLAAVALVLLVVRPWQSDSSVTPEPKQPGTPKVDVAAPPAPSSPSGPAVVTAPTPAVSTSAPASPKTTKPSKPVKPISPSAPHKDIFAP